MRPINKNKVVTCCRAGAGLIFPIRLSQARKRIERYKMSLPAFVPTAAGGGGGSGGGDFIILIALSHKKKSCGSPCSRLRFTGPGPECCSTESIESTKDGQKL